MQITADISLWLILPILVGSIGLAWWFYRGNDSWIKGLLPWQRLSLVSLRTIALFILGLLFLGIVLQTYNYQTEEPIVVVAVDNSRSMVNYKDSSLIKGQVNAFLEAAKDRLGDKFQVVPLNFNNGTSPFDSAHFTGTHTDLAKGFKELRKQYFNRNLASVVLISDGNFNQGVNPIYDAEALRLVPVFSLGVGDSVQKRDQRVKQITANEVAFLNNEFPVLIDVDAFKMGKGKSQLLIEENGEVIAKADLTYQDGIADFVQHAFQLKATSVGFHKYSVRLKREENESNYQNNVRTFYVEVIDSRSKVLLLSSAPHPDLAAIREALETDANSEVDYQTAANFSGSFKGYNLVIWHNPKRSSSRFVDALKQEKVPVLYIVGPSADSDVVNQLGIGLRIPNSSQTDEVEAKANAGFQAFELTEVIQTQLAAYPPLVGRFGRFQTGKNIEVLAYQRIGSIQKQEPLIFFGTASNSVRYGVIYGEGVWRWKLDEYRKEQSFDQFFELINSMRQYLVASQHADPFRVRLPKRITQNEDVFVHATVLDKTLNAVTDATVQFRLTDEQGKNSKLEFGVEGKGYVLNAGKLKPGAYSWEATAKQGGRQFKKSGTFVVESVNLEQLETRANLSLLNQLSMNSAGSFGMLSNYTKTLDEISSREDLTSVTYQELTFIDLIDWLWMLIFALVVLTSEWFLRRYWGSY